MWAEIEEAEEFASSVAIILMNYYAHSIGKDWRRVHSPLLPLQLSLWRRYYRS